MMMMVMLAFIGVLALIIAPSISLQLQTETRKFAGVRIPPQIATAIQHLNIQSPTPIQSAAISPLCCGTSCVLHASTGTGKTFAFVVPALKRLFDDSNVDRTKPLQALIIAPTKELAEQIIADVTLLSNDKSIIQSFSQKVYVRPNAPLPDLPTAPIIIGTPWRILDMLSDSRIGPIVASNLGYLVLDEVDRLVPTKSRYLKGAPAIDEDGTYPVSLIVDMLKKYRCRIQVVGASATVGRPLRRELHRLLTPIMWDADTTPTTTKSRGKTATIPEGSYGGQFPVIRPIETEKIILKTANVDDDDDSIKVENTASRYVSIPKHIRHIILIDSTYETGVNHKLSILKKFYIDSDNFPESRRALLFLPKNDDVIAARPVLKFFGLQNLYVVTELKEKPLPPLIFEGKIEKKDNEMILAAFTGTRGLHLTGVDTVLVSEPPKGMDEYLHIAGRTGRMDLALGNKRRTMRSTVVTIADPEQIKRMDGWQTALDIKFERVYV